MLVVVFNINRLYVKLENVSLENTDDAVIDFFGCNAMFCYFGRDKHCPEPGTRKQRRVSCV